MLGTPITRALVSFLIWTAHGAQAGRAASQSALDAFLARNPIVTQSVGNAKPTDTASSIAAQYSAGNYPSKSVTPTRCPTKCSTTGPDPNDWPVYSSVDRLSWCHEPMLVNFALYNSLNDSQTHSSLRVCSADYSASTASKRDSTNSCLAEGTNQTEVSSSLQLAWSNTKGAGNIDDVVTALQQLGNSLTSVGSGCNETINFAYSGKAAVGLYLGSGLEGQEIASSVLKDFISHVQSEGISENRLVQLCDGASARYSMGIIANANADLASVQEVVKQWRNSSCIASFDNAAAWQNISYLAPTVPVHSNISASASLLHRAARKTDLQDRATACTTAQVVSGDSCAMLAAECGITAAQFTTYNPSPTFCSSLAVGQYVCCSAGTLPDNTPKPSSSGYCFSYTIKSGDSCSALAASYTITVALIQTYNTGTWGWSGCASLFIGNYICLSSGYPPMPATIPSANCGPQMNATAAVPPGTDLSTINGCPLNACCDIWGQCGTTAEFCTQSNSSTNSPGTAAPGTNGCISNCGTAIITGSAPASVFKIGYFEAFDWQRPCLSGAVIDFDTSSYTHIHLAFLTFNADFTMNISSIAGQWETFVGMIGPKRIVSIGGWSFSTDPGTYMLFRQGVALANRATLVKNIVNFLNQYHLDGVDLDWEYPAEPDIPGIPASTAEDASNFFLFMYQLKASIPAGKTISVTAPSSYWYLHTIPIEAISLVVDYVVFMTYDLHGQWDYGNAFSDPGCPGGNCLRSDVNLTETINALSMITKANIPANKVIVGVASYGRSFQMTTPGCITEMCTYTGPLSGASPGPCTDTAGYIANGEINDIIASNPNIQQSLDSSYTNILVYNSNQWVGYMDDSNKAVRSALYAAYNFGGTADWAIDLQSNGNGAGSNSGSGSGSCQGYIDPIVWGQASPVVTGPPGCTLIWPPLPLSTTTTITFPLWTTQITVSTMTSITTTFNNGQVTVIPSFVVVTIPTVITIPAVVTNSIPVWGIVLPSGQSSGPIYITSSVQPPPFGITVTPIFGGTTSVHNPTSTTTGNGTVVIWGGFTYSSSPVTQTLGGSTTVIGGITLAPIIATVTPQPYPTTTASTTDPVLNTRPTAWQSGTNVGPPCIIGCGWPCILFCDSGCPFCPPGFGGFGGGGGGSNPSPTGTQTKPSSSSSTEDLDTFAGFATAYPCEFVNTFVGAGELSSMFQAEAANWLSMYPAPTPTTPTSTITIISTSTSPPTTTTIVVVVTPTPTTASCAFWDEGWGWTFEVYNIQGWSTDGGGGLHTQENGCGALTGWNWEPSTNTYLTRVYFNLPFFIKDGCVERAIVSAGGPKISCAGQGTDFKKRNLETPMLSGLSPPPWTDADRKAAASFYSNATEWHPYVTMDWTAPSAVQV